MGRAGRVDFSGIVKEVSLCCVPEAAVGDYVIVHVGMAISRLDEDEAKKTFEYLRAMNELSDLDAPSQSPPSESALSDSGSGP